MNKPSLLQHCAVATLVICFLLVSVLGYSRYHNGAATVDRWVGMSCADHSTELSLFKNTWDSTGVLLPSSKPEAKDNQCLGTIRWIQEANDKFTEFLAIFPLAGDPSVNDLAWSDPHSFWFGLHTNTSLGITITNKTTGQMIPFNEVYKTTSTNLETRALVKELARQGLLGIDISTWPNIEGNSLEPIPFIKVK